ncbi:MAG: hypothetical protein JOZ39_04770, partial [Chloroflexi bacterium]|nr:hypothetical protein [Chloroflexota bacterium]
PTEDIAVEAQRPFKIAVCGPHGAGKTTLINRLAGGAFGHLVEPFGLRHIVELPTPLTPNAIETAAQADLVIWLQDVTAPAHDPGLDELRRRAPAFLEVLNKGDLLVDAVLPPGALLICADSSESVRRQLAPAIVDCVPELSLALARGFSLFRDEVAAREIQRVARVNAEIAVVSAIPQASVLLGPVSAVADTLLLTKNQAVLILRLAAMFGLSIDRRRITELLPVAGAAFGWRTLARELVGFVPAGLGVVPKAVIAYAGTMATGHAALWYYQTGRKMPERQLKQVYAESANRARDLARDLAQRFRRAG